MRPSAEFDVVRGLIEDNLNDCEVARRTGVPRGTVREWRLRTSPPGQPVAGSLHRKACARCHNHPLEQAEYAYLLGLYLGDGCISLMRRGVFRLRVVLDVRYPRIVEECAAVMAAVGPRPPGVQLYATKHYAEVHAGWKHWPCLFPQHGPGRKHHRTIELEPWQRQLVERSPELLVRGLIHSDGSRFDNKVKGKAYARYQFTNLSEEIRGIFCWACDLYGVRWRQSSWRTISVSRRPDVAKLDMVIGPKR